MDGSISRERTVDHGYVLEAETVAGYQIVNKEFKEDFVEDVEQNQRE